MNIIEKTFIEDRNWRNNQKIQEFYDTRTYNSRHKKENIVMAKKSDKMDGNKVVMNVF